MRRTRARRRRPPPKRGPESKTAGGSASSIPAERLLLWQTFTHAPPYGVNRVSHRFECPSHSRTTCRNLTDVPVAGRVCETVSVEAAQGFDYVIVGAGTAGCVLAARLSEDADRTVCLIEAGGRAGNVFASIPGTVGIALSVDALNWRFQSVPQPNLDNRRIPVPRGRGLVGLGLIKRVVYVRGHASDYDDWAAAGVTGWSFREVLPYFTKSEANENFPASVFHARDGPLNFRRITHPNA